AEQVTRLRRLHLSVGLAVIALGLLWPALAWDYDHGRGLVVLDSVLLTLLGLVLVTAGVGVCLHQVLKRRWPEEQERRFGTEVLPWVALGLLLLSVAAARAPPTAGPR